MLNFIVNTGSGKGKGFKTLRKIIDFCYKKRVEYTVHVTASKGHASAIAKALCENNASTLVAVGGDGTFHEVINGVKGYDKVRVGFIPAGRGNDFARAAKLHLNPIKALEDIIRNEETAIDIIEVGERRCLNTAGTGLDVAVLNHVEDNAGKLTYLLALIKCIKNFNPYKLKVRIGEEIKSFEVITIGICNGTCIGGGMKISPHSVLDDGKLNVVVVKMPEDGKIMKALSGFLSGKHITKSYVEEIICDEIDVESEDIDSCQLDGEVYQGLPLTCKLINNGLKTFKTTGK